MIFLLVLVKQSMSNSNSYSPKKSLKMYETNNMVAKSFQQHLW